MFILKPPILQSRLSVQGRNTTPQRLCWFCFMLIGSALLDSQTWCHLNGTHLGLSCCVEKVDRRGGEEEEVGGETLNRWRRVKCHYQMFHGSGLGLGLISEIKQLLYGNDFQIGFPITCRALRILQCMVASLSDITKMDLLNWRSFEPKDRKWAETYRLLIVMRVYKCGSEVLCQ